MSDYYQLTSKHLSFILCNIIPEEIQNRMVNEALLSCQVHGNAEAARRLAYKIRARRGWRRRRKISLKGNFS